MHSAKTLALFIESFSSKYSMDSTISVVYVADSEPTVFWAGLGWRDLLLRTQRVLSEGIECAGQSVREFPLLLSGFYSRHCWFACQGAADGPAKTRTKLRPRNKRNTLRSLPVRTIMLAPKSARPATKTCPRKVFIRRSRTPPIL